MNLNDLNKDLIYYICSPYSTPVIEGITKEIRYQQVVDIEAELVKEGFITYGPIASSHPMALKHQLGQTYDYWMRRDRALVTTSGGIFVATLEGWENSVGVSDEIALAVRQDKPVYLLELEGTKITGVRLYYAG